jgi:hypothetical protein
MMDVYEICEAGNPHSSQLSNQELIGISVSYRFRPCSLRRLRLFILGPERNNSGEDTADGATVVLAEIRNRL